MDDIKDDEPSTDGSYINNNTEKPGKTILPVSARTYYSVIDLPLGFDEMNIKSHKRFQNDTNAKVYSINFINSIDASLNKELDIYKTVLNINDIGYRDTINVFDSKTITTISSNNIRYLCNGFNYD